MLTVRLITRSTLYNGFQVSCVITEYLNSATGEQLKITDVLHEDMTECVWIDGFGRKVLLRQRVVEEVLKHLKNLSEEVLTKDTIELQSYMVQTINNGSFEE